MIAMVLTALAIMGILALYVTEPKASGFSRHTPEAAVLAQDKIEFLRTQASGPVNTTETNLNERAQPASGIYKRTTTETVIAGAVSMSQGFREQRAAVLAEGAVRVPLDFMAEAIRQASPGSPTNLVYDSYACTGLGLNAYNNPGTPSGANGITAGTDKLDVVFASGAVITSTREIYNNSPSLAVTAAN